MTKIAGFALMLIFTAALLGIGFLVVTARDLDEDISFKASVLIEKPNQFLMCPDGYCGDTPHAVSPVFDKPVAEMMAAWDKVVAAAPRLRKVPEKDPMRRNYIQRSKLLRFPDAISVEFTSLGPDKSSLAVFSRSKYGHSDVGVNEARVRGWLRELDRRLKAS